MSNRRGVPKTWVLQGLPSRPETSEQSFRFDIGPLKYVPPYDERTVYLHIPEIACRDAEGRPAHPEQAEWINQVLAQYEIKAQEVWWSHWEFSSAEDSAQFEQVLQQFGATELRT